jgi:hypothetical protein
MPGRSRSPSSFFSFFSFFLLLRRIGKYARVVEKDKGGRPSAQGKARVATRTAGVFFLGAILAIPSIPSIPSIPGKWKASGIIGSLPGRL